EFLESFFQGFAQGMKLTIQLDLMRADDPHHLWEACFRAFGCALEESLRLDEWKQGGIAGVKGTID
ncbi:MAG: imidazoleglycerol-phosphate dehydratase, partial [Candidatus Bathyarchaeia archaeon]